MDFFGTLALIILAWKSRTLLVYMIFLSIIRLGIFGISLQRGYGMFTMEYIQRLASELYVRYGMNKVPVIVKNIKDLRDDTGTYDIKLPTLGGDFDGDPLSMNPPHIVYLKISERNPLRWIWSLYRDAFILYSLISNIDKTKKENPYIFDMSNEYKITFKEVLKILFTGRLS